MGALNRVPAPRLVVVGIDGVSRSLLSELMACGAMPAARSLLGHPDLVELLSVYPTVSSAAWTSFMTGLHPPRHGIMGFVNKIHHGYGISFPRREEIRGRLLQEIVSDAGGSVFSMGVPVTFPPMQLRGVVISCFLAPGLDKAVAPIAELTTLRELGYAIDPDPLVAHQDRQRFMQLIFHGLDRRIATVQHYFRRQQWDLFLVHVMETDRLHHFFWQDHADPGAQFHDDFFRFYQRLDALFEWLGNEMGDATRLIVLSDHGFCGLDWEVNLGKWMVEKGWTALRTTTPAPPLANVDWSRTRLYSMIPGRVWVNLKGREPEGIVSPDEKVSLLEGLRAAVDTWRDPRGVPVIEKVLVEEQIPGFSGNAGTPDAILVPRNGMDLKDGALRPEVFERKALNGMHTYENALLSLGSGHKPLVSNPWIGDLAPTLLSLLGCPAPDDLDGRSLV